MIEYHRHKDIRSVTRIIRTRNPRVELSDLHVYLSGCYGNWNHTGFYDRTFEAHVQTGTQPRCAPQYREVQRIIQSGELGEVRYVPSNKNRFLRSHKDGRKLHWDASKEDFSDEPEASQLLQRQTRKPWDLI